MRVEISFKTWQALTSLLQDEDDSYDRLIGRLISKGEVSSDIEETVQSEGRVGAVYKGVFLPSGTQLRASYKGRTYYGKVEGADWIDVGTGDRRSSPSQAAYSITGSGVNGWLFWLVKRPGDQEWRSLNELRVSGDDSTR